MFDISVLGDKKLQKKLSDLDKKVGSKVMKDAMRQSMSTVKDLAKQRAPVVTGMLRKSIRIGVKSNRKGVSAMVRTGTRKQLKISPDNPFYYPAAHEYGTRYMPARSFLRSSLGDRKNMVLSSLSGNIRRILEK